jgi:magnesium transporter
MNRFLGTTDGEAPGPGEEFLGSAVVDCGV